VLFPSKSVVQDRHREAGYVLDLAASPAQALLPPCIRWPASPTLSRRPVAASNGGSIRPYKSWTHVFDELIQRRPVRTGILNVPQGSRLGRLLCGGTSASGTSTWLAVVVVTSPTLLTSRKRPASSPSFSRRNSTASAPFTASLSAPISATRAPVVVALERNSMSMVLGAVQSPWMTSETSNVASMYQK
jgi:hypothetical protein